MPLHHHQSLLLWFFGSIPAAAIIDDSIAAKINTICRQCGKFAAKSAKLVPKSSMFSQK
jgi:hypothetical protein